MTCCPNCGAERPKPKGPQILDANALRILDYAGWIRRQPRHVDARDAVFLALNNRGCSMARAARFVGMNPSSVSSAVKRARVKAAERPAFAELVKRLEAVR